MRETPRTSDCWRTGRSISCSRAGTVIGWACGGWYEKGWGELELLEIDGPGGDGFTDDVELALSLEAFVASLPPGDGEVAALWLLEGLESDQVAERLGKQPNAIYQARHRLLPKLRE